MLNGFDIAGLIVSNRFNAKKRLVVEDFTIPPSCIGIFLLVSLAPVE